MRDWILREFRYDISPRDMRMVSDFTVLWNLYESFVFNNHCGFNKIKTKINKIDFNNNDIDSCFRFCIERYTFDHETTDYFDGLNLSRELKKNQECTDYAEIRNILLSKTPTIKDKAYCIAVILFRIRCNLFHGEKDIQTLCYQHHLFDSLMNFMKMMILKFRPQN